MVLPSDGGCVSVLESDDSDWSIGWLELRGLEFQSDDDPDGSFAVLVPCYGRGCVANSSGGFNANVGVFDIRKVPSGGKVVCFLIKIFFKMVYQIRGRDSIVHPAMLEIRNTIETILLWPSLDGDEVSKAQHGCIDCLALIICTELQDPKLFRDLTTKKSSLVRTPSWSRDAAMRNSVLSCVIACQKMPNSGKKPFALKVLPHLIQSVEPRTSTSHDYQRPANNSSKRARPRRNHEPEAARHQQTNNPQPRITHNREDIRIPAANTYQSCRSRVRSCNRQKSATRSTAGVGRGPAKVAGGRARAGKGHQRLGRVEEGSPEAG
ncbi:hypothetical protein RHGRI_007266 [Rhododendron griersonianum]|uniref:Uncharacterized protein n=1 Tax=Rhododendron griersonianum TaxID=479676 RepID=A0AAV6KXZ7_9ERIC|nr:hypothetical protein RHGRI_007266 [Rhododendron griersonianum]